MQRVKTRINYFTNRMRYAPLRSARNVTFNPGTTAEKMSEMAVDAGCLSALWKLHYLNL